MSRTYMITLFFSAAILTMSGLRVSDEKGKWNKSSHKPDSERNSSSSNVQLSSNGGGRDGKEMFLGQLFHLEHKNLCLISMPKEGCTVWKTIFLAYATGHTTDVHKWRKYKETWNGNIHTYWPSVSDQITGLAEISIDDDKAKSCKHLFPVRDPKLRAVSSYLDNQARFLHATQLKESGATVEGEPACWLQLFPAGFPKDFNLWLTEIAAMLNASSMPCMANHFYPLSEIGLLNLHFTEGDDIIHLEDTPHFAELILDLSPELIEDIIHDGTSHSHLHMGIEWSTNGNSTFDRVYNEDVIFYNDLCCKSPNTNLIRYNHESVKPLLLNPGYFD